MDLDAVIELEVDEGRCQAHGARVAETKARGGRSREDDNPEAFRVRLSVTYREQTAPVSDYFSGVGDLHAVDGMAAIDEVSAAIDASAAQQRLAAGLLPSGRRRDGKTNTRLVLT